MTKKSGRIFHYRPPILTDPQLAVISEILRSTGLIIFGAEIIPFVFGEVDKPNWIIVVLALGLTSILYVTSILIVHNIKRYEF